MALTLQTIINFTETQFKLRLIAGKSGITKTVSWIYYTEDVSTIEFIRGGELAVTLGINFQRQKDNLNINSDNYLYEFLKEYIDNFIKHNASGLIINTGKYITDIPQSVIDYCNEKDFPLLTMPWEVHTIDLMQDVGNMISSDNHNTHTLEKYFYNSIFEKEKFNPKEVEDTIFHDAKSYSVVLMELHEEFFNNDMGKINRYIHYNFNHRMSFEQNLYSCFIHKHKIIYVIKDSNFLFLHEILNTAKSDRYFNDSKISVSDYGESVSDLADLYEHAAVALEINSSEDQINYYENLGIFKILVAVKNQKVLQKFYDETLGKIEELESAKKEDYLKTLSLYLKNGGNILQVAEKNNAHRNTILYRLNRMEEILNADFSDGETRTKLQTALYIRTLLSKKI